MVGLGLFNLGHTLSFGMVRVWRFERFTERYDAWFEKFRATYLSELGALSWLVGEFERGLEVGVGTGRFAVPLGVRFGVDPSTRMLEVARRRGVEVLRGVAERLPFRGGLFDLVLMVTTICFVVDLDASFREVSRVLRPAGRFVLGFIDRDSPVGRRASSMVDDPFYSEATMYSVGEVVGNLEGCGFRVERFAQTVFGYPENIREVQPAKPGHGEGSFVVVQAKPS